MTLRRELVFGEGSTTGNIMSYWFRNLKEENFDSENESRGRSYPRVNRLW